MQDPTPTAGPPAATDLIPNAEAASSTESAPAPAVLAQPAVEAAPSPSRARARTIGLATLGGVIAIGALAIAFAAGGANNETAPAVATDGSTQQMAPVGAISGWTSPDGMSNVRPDHLRGGGMRGGIRGEMGKAITITAIDGTRLALRTDNGWTRTIDAAGATVTKDGTTAALSDLKVGDQIVFRETRNADGTYTITAIVVIQPTVGGTVASVTGDTVTVTRRDGSTSKVVLTSSTTYEVAGTAAAKDAVVAGARIVARGTLASDGTLTASSVEVAPAASIGTVKEKSSSSLTLTERDGSTVVVKVTSATTYQVGGVETATLADVKVGDVVMAAGSRNGDGSLSATIVRSHAAGQFGGPGDGFGPGAMPGLPGMMFGNGFGPGGLHGDGRGWGFPGAPDDSSAPFTAPSDGGTNG